MSESSSAGKSGKSAGIWGTGRRKTAVARVCLLSGQGQFTVNDRPLDTYFSEERDRATAILPLKVCGSAGPFDVRVRVDGGGPTGQAGAIQMGLARALIKINAEVKKSLQGVQATTRDSRMKERKKYGQRGARRRFQFSKR